MSIAHRQPLNVRMQCTTPTVMHSGRRYKASRPLGRPKVSLGRTPYCREAFQRVLLEIQCPAGHKSLPT